jgi:type VI protein secretion system component Hcp
MPILHSFSGIDFPDIPGFVAVLAVGSSPASAVLHIKFDGIDCEVKDKDHKDWCDALSFFHGLRKPQDSNSPRRRGDVIIDDLLFTKELDKASSKIAEVVVNGKVYPKVEIHLTASYTDAGSSTAMPK